ncbi:MAG TPA: DUF2167 domain-containing protein [Kofleriaceae bacterium]|jgi:uncharacterized membrane-anchored protein
MGLREAIVTTVILGFATAAAADAKKPAKSEPAKAAKKGGETKAAEAPEPAAPPDADAKAEGSDAEKEEPPHVVGPKHIELGNSASIDLPDGMIMFERAVAQDLMRKSDENAEHIVGIVFKPESSWHVLIEYLDSGYVEDSDADDLDADDLLDSYRKGTAEQNKIRKSHGSAELLIDGWSEKPRYERTVHHLLWGLNAHASDGEKIVNYFTRVLGRNGFLSVNLIDAPERLEASKKEAAPVLQATHFNAGSTYADHVSSDRSSGIGLRGLVLGGAGVAVASKLGLFAKLLFVFKKGFILVFAALAALFRKVFRRKREPDAGTLDPSSVPMAPPPTAPPPMGPTSMGGPGDPHDGSSR